MLGAADSWRRLSRRHAPPSHSRRPLSLSPLSRPAAAADALARGKPPPRSLVPSRENRTAACVRVPQDRASLHKFRVFSGRPDSRLAEAAPIGHTRRSCSISSDTLDKKRDHDIIVQCEGIIIPTPKARHALSRRNTERELSTTRSCSRRSTDPRGLRSARRRQYIISGRNHRCPSNYPLLQRTAAHSTNRVVPGN